MEFNNIDLNILINTMQKIAREECKKLMQEKNIEQNLYGTIVEVNNDGTYNVQIAGVETIYPSMKNKSNVATLSIGDSILVKAINSNLGNAYIAIKMG